MSRPTVVVPLVALFVVAAACTSGSPAAKSLKSDERLRGGTLRLAVPTSQLGYLQLDPRSYGNPDWELFRCCLLRTLYSYNGKPTEKGGAELRPDLAAGPPQISDDGLTWTFRLKEGLRYAPPFEDVEITSPDIVRAMQREARVTSGKDLGNYAFYFSKVQGFDAYRAGSADSIGGLETPDDHTLVVRLDQVTGDLAYRFSLAATAPIPAEPHDPSAPLGVATGHDDDYDRYLVASGPYMVQGADELDFSVPLAQQEPAAGYVPAELGEGGVLESAGSLTLVRNPSWDRSTDALRAAYPDLFELVLGGDPEQIAHDVDQGSLDLQFGDVPQPEQVERYSEDPELSRRLFVYPNDSLYYVAMNLAVPPFDDVHVRKAVSMAIDKTKLVAMVSRPPYGPFLTSHAEVAAHIAPDALEGSLLRDFVPYPHDPARARAEMRRSAYDSNGDGRCDDPACRGIRAPVLESGVIPDQARAIRDDLAGLGIELDLENAPDHRFFEGLLGDPSNRIPMAIGEGWGKDLPVGTGWFQGVLESAGLGEGGNATMLGASPGQLRRWGYSVTTVPSVDDRIQVCVGTSGRAQTECWVELDQYLMTEVVPWVPYMFTEVAQVVSERVVAYSSDQFTTLPALDRIAVAQGST